MEHTYNGYGELVTQQNARSQTTTIIYNADGTIKRKETPEGLVKYRYNTNKQLVNVNSYGTVSHTYSYDSKGRVISVIDTIPGTTPLTTSFNYDIYGRMSTITYPSGIIETINYNVNGYLSSISAGGSTRWTTTSMNARRQVTAGQYGSDLSATYGFDAYGYPASTITGTLQSYSYNFNTVTGNLNWRQNNKYTGLKETFNYDNADRLDNVYQGTGTPVLTLDMAYDSNKGGITTKSDAGTMIYNYPGNPYALGAISPTTGLVPSITQSITYTSFESVSTISENNYVSSFTYNPEAERAKMVVQQSGNAILTRWYSGSSYVKETAGGVTKQYTFIGGDAYTAPVVAIKTGTGTPVYYYLLRDYLGSITHVVNTSKTTVAEYSYDAWGRMRNPTNWTNYTPGTEPALFVAGRGFTGHEHLPWFNSINMNGRVYDPLIGQFLSPDNYVQDPTFTQNYNRYTYCLNNPLSYNDPSGNTYKAYMDERYGEGNYWHRGQAPGTWGGGGSSHGGGCGSGSTGGSYYYNWYTGQYKNDAGITVDFNEVYNNYIVPNSSDDPQDVIDILNSFNASGGLGPQSPRQDNNYISQIIDPCGVNEWVMFPNRLQAELYLKANSNCDKEKFFYINSDKSVLVGPWNDADRNTVSPRYLEPFNNGYVIFNHNPYEVDYFVHTHPDHYTPGYPRDNDVHNFFNYWGISTLIYYRNNYYYYDNKNTYHFVP